MGQARLLISIILILTVFQSFCTDEQPYSPNTQPGRIVGMVKPEGLVAQIKLLQGVLLKMVQTDSTGYFKIDSVNAGVYNLEILAEGYGKYIINSVTVYSGNTTATPDVYLKPFPEQIFSINPPDGTENFSLDSPIIIEFTRLMNHSSVENNWFLIPEVEGEFYWNDTSEKSTVRFLPGDQYITDFNYSFMLTEDVVDAYGDSLSFSVTSYFRTEPVKIVGVIPEKSANYISPQTGIYIDFNSKMNRQSVEDGFTMTPITEGEIKWFDSRRMLFQPATLLASNTQYSFSIKTSAKDIYNNFLEDEDISSFFTEPLTIASNYPIHGSTHVSRSTPIVLTFNTYVNQQSVENAFTINPEIEGWSFQWSDLTRVQYTGTSKLLANTLYSVTIDTTCKDLWGNLLPQVSRFSFTTSD